MSWSSFTFTNFMLDRIYMIYKSISRFKFARRGSETPDRRSVRSLPVGQTGSERQKLDLLSILKNLDNLAADPVYFLNWWRRSPAPRWGNMRRLTPVSRKFGFDRGFCIDRFYIETFLKTQRQHIRGRVLEVANANYTHKFGGNRVTRADVLHLTDGNPQATLIGDLTTGQGIPQEAFDCLILTQTYPFIYDVPAAVKNSCAALKPGGVLLATFPGISQISRYDMERWGDYWRFTDASARRLFGDVFGPDNVTVETFGNVFAACAFLHGLAAHELTSAELAYNDPDYQLIITVKAIKRVTDEYISQLSINS